jgi:hypothetical protein
MSDERKANDFTMGQEGFLKNLDFVVKNVTDSFLVSESRGSLLVAAAILTFVDAEFYIAYDEEEDKNE